VVAEDGAHLAGEFVVGWIKRGPSGVIGTNKKCAADTVARILEDVAAGQLHEPPLPDPHETERWLRERVPGLVAWAGWQAIDAHESRLGLPHGRPRVKLVHVGEMRDVAAGVLR
jgi:ferredoxin--NADP+ reductase